MPIKYLSIICGIMMYACKTPDKPILHVDPYDQYTSIQKDSIAEMFNNLSDYMSQPSDRHRLYKDSAILLSPTNVEYRQVLSYSYKKRGDHIKAMRILNEAVAMDLKKGSRDALQYRAWSLLYFYRDYDGTISDVDKIHAMGQRKYCICWGEPCGLLKGQALYRLHQYDEAIRVLDSVLTEEVKLGFKSEDNYLVHFYTGRCHHQNKNYQKALKSYQTVLDTDQNYTEALYQIGLIYQSQGDKIKSRIYLERAMNLVKSGHKMGEPYFERFDEVFEWQIEEALDGIKASGG
jgi:tetratricopeptide (TPR) repeat protein